MQRFTRTALLATTLALGLSGLYARPAGANAVNFTPIKDNTIFSDLTGNSNGAGDGVYAGKNSIGGLRRGLVAFDLSSIPAGSTITSAALILNMSQTNSGAHTVSVHRLNADWGEGTSSGSGQGAAATTGDATWIRRFFNTLSWGTAGGDFVGTASASQSVDAVGTYIFSSPGLQSDVTAWVASPSSNFGWILIGDEGPLQTAKKFDSRQGTVAPILRVIYTPPVPGASPIGLGLLGLVIAAAGGLILRRRLEA